MRELILKMSIAIDGFVASPDGRAKRIFDTHDDEAAEWPVKTVWGASLHIMGSGTFPVVDQYALLVHPVALRKGLPLFAGLHAPRILELLGSTTFPRATIAQIYRPA